jgi:hypothetical protein
MRTHSKLRDPPSHAVRTSFDFTNVRHFRIVSNLWHRSSPRVQRLFRPILPTLQCHVFIPVKSGRVLCRHKPLCQPRRSNTWPRPQRSNTSNVSTSDKKTLLSKECLLIGFSTCSVERYRQPTLFPCSPHSTESRQSREAGTSGAHICTAQRSRLTFGSFHP